VECLAVADGPEADAVADGDLILAQAAQGFGSHGDRIRVEAPTVFGSRETRQTAESRPPATGTIWIRYARAVE
jgi:hypothetical protein